MGLYILNITTKTRRPINPSLFRWWTTLRSTATESKTRQLYPDLQILIQSTTIYNRIEQTIQIYTLIFSDFHSIKF